MPQISKRPRARTTSKMAAAISLATLCLVSCSGGDDGNQTEANLAASQLCASTLDAPAVASIERMGEIKEFTELPGTNDAGKPNKFSLKQAADTLHDDMTQRNQCVVFKAGDTTSHPLITVDFSAVKFYPKKTRGGSEDSGASHYRMGVYAAARGTAGASLYFKCPTKNPDAPGQSTPYVEAELIGTPDQLSAKSTGRDRMTVLNAVSRAMAKQLGCASQASLPSRVPAGQPD
ncbi:MULTISPECIES: hypothetical protein [unclassified Streptomyces]|uniref:hypothetical protein n=2 Tax=Streptomyces TaxID=1883 RepID=UPI0022525551|nr:hypothetical protein [Streptomyces sp. NBC_00401]MCX5082037.1 hypothetical protein [Streptomyces sp. NBC_00401]